MTPTDTPFAPATTPAPAPRPVTDRPPGPPCPWWGLPRLRAQARDYLGEMDALQRAHGDLTHMRLGPERTYDVFDPAWVREALVDQAAKLVRWEHAIDLFGQAFGDSVLVSEGERWQRQRRMLMPAFTPRRVQGYAALMVDAARRALDEALPAGAGHVTVDIGALSSRVTMDVILRTLFSRPDEGEADVMIEATQVLGRQAMREMFWPVMLPDWLPLPGKRGKRRAMRALHGLVDRHLERRRAMPPAQAPQDDLLAMLMGARDELGQPLSAQELHDECAVMFQAGHETSATALTWWAWLVAGDADEQDALCAEVDAVLHGRAPQAGDVPALDRLGASLKEALRLYPPLAALMTRRVRAPLRLGPWTVPAGALLRVTPWVIQRDARWFPEPAAFRPQRFTKDAEPPPRGAWLPFGTGPRVCIGQHFAMLEMTLTAALLLQRVRLERLPREPDPVPTMNVTLRPQGPMRLRLRRRDPGVIYTRT